MCVSGSAYIFSKETHGQDAGIYDTYTFALQVGYKVFQGPIVQTVVTVRQDDIYGAFRNPAEASQS